MITTNSTPFTMPVQPACSGYGNGGNGMWGDGSWWIIVLVILLFGGWGARGWGGNDGGYGGGYVSDNYALITDNATLERKIDGVYSGICDSTFALNNTITNGFASAQNTMTQGFAGLNTALVTQGYESRIATQGVGNTVQNCCCDLRQQIGDVKYTIGSTGADISRGVERGFADTNYNLATQSNMLDRTIADKFCQTNFNAATNTRDVIDSQNANTRAILDKLCQMESNAKDEKIAELTAKNADLRLAASQAAQNEYLVERLNPNPCPQPAYVVQPPRQVTFPTNCCGYATYGNTGCGCGNVQ